ncbi:MAG: TIGR04282 family arsenosugar biosynthesis glycosyltransferase [Betaproteobacteria bacterium]
MATLPGDPEAVHIAVLARAPTPGRAKTRLIPALGAPGAARLHRSMTLRTLLTAQRAQLGEVSLWCAPDRQHRFFRALQRRHGVACHDQPEADLGQRMLHALRHPKAPCLVIGTDCPALTSAHLHQAAHALRSGQDAVFLPVEDGGYALVGWRCELASLFEAIDWSTERVMAQTRQRLRSAGASWQELETLWDVDLPQDLARLATLELPLPMQKFVGVD